MAINERKRHMDTNKTNQSLYQQTNKQTQIVHMKLVTKEEANMKMKQEAQQKPKSVCFSLLSSPIVSLFASVS